MISSFSFETFLKTTDPYTPYSKVMTKEVVFSILFHLTAYFMAYFGLVKLFKLPYKPKAMIIFLLVVMTLGFYGRLFRVKSMFETYKKMGMEAKEAREKASDMLRTGYFTWYFLS